jgi:putative addiction module component (TIGR02574 family)
MQPQQLTEAALSLPEPQRIELAASLIHSLEPAPDPEAEACWADEIRRRLESIDDGTAKLFPADEVFAEMKQRRDG